MSSANECPGCDGSGVQKGRDGAPPGCVWQWPCPLCDTSQTPELAQAVHDVEATHTLAPVWDLHPRGEA